MKSREEATKKLERLHKMRDTDKIVYLLEIITDLLLYLRFGDK